MSIKVVVVVVMAYHKTQYMRYGSPLVVRYTKPNKRKSNVFCVYVFWLHTKGYHLKVPFFATHRLKDNLTTTHSYHPTNRYINTHSTLLQVLVNFFVCFTQKVVFFLWFAAHHSHTSQEATTKPTYDKI